MAGKDGGKSGGKEEKGEEEEPLSRAEIKAMIDASANGAAKAQFSRLAKQLDQTIAAAIAKAIQPKGESAGDEGESAGDEGGEGDPPAGGKAPIKGVPDEWAKRFASLEDQNRKLRKKDADRDKREREAADRRDRDEERQRLTEALVKGRAAPDMLKPALALLLHEEKRLRRVAEGEDKVLRFVHRGADGEEELDVESGVAKWLATDEGKRFLPPKDARGSGASGSGPDAGSGKGQPMSLADLGSALGGLS